MISPSGKYKDEWWIGPLSLSFGTFAITSMCGPQAEWREGTLKLHLDDDCILPNTRRVMNPYLLPQWWPSVVRVSDLRHASPVRSRSLDDEVPLSRRLAPSTGRIYVNFKLGARAPPGGSIVSTVQRSTLQRLATAHILQATLWHISSELSKAYIAFSAA